MLSSYRTYRIRIKDHVNINWSVWFENLAVEHEDTGETVICGDLLDQAALHGVLMKIRDLGLTLVEVKYIPCDSDTREE